MTLSHCQRNLLRTARSGFRVYGLFERVSFFMEEWKGGGGERKEEEEEKEEEKEDEEEEE